MSKLKLAKKKHKVKMRNYDIKEDLDSKTTQMDSSGHKNVMFERAIASAKKHNINLESGRENSGGGDCAYYSVIFNINDRGCFHNKFPMSPDVYRRIWNVDMMNKVLDKKVAWNPGMTKHEIQEGFQELMEPGVYERSFFGDMILPGIACGTRKRILIFNTNENIKTTGHDPISVVDPRDHGGEIDNEIPVVVAYNLVHFESLHPVDDKDITETIRLVNSYSLGKYKEEYGFTRDDIARLLSKNSLNPPQETSSKEREPEEIRSPPPKKLKNMKTGHNKSFDFSEKNETIHEKAEEFIFEDILFKETENGKIKCGVCEVECTKLVVHMNGNKYCTEYFSNMAKFKVEYSKHRDKRSKMKNERKRKILTHEDLPENYGKKKQNCELKHSRENPNKDEKVSPENDHKERSETGENNAKEYEKEECFRFGGYEFKDAGNGKTICAVCLVECIRLVAHMNGSKECAEKFCMPVFKTEYSKHRHRLRVRKNEARKKNEDPKGFRDDLNKRVKENETRKKEQDLKGFKEDHNKREKKYEIRKKEQDPNGFRDDHNKRVKENETRKKEQDPKGFNDNLKKRVRECEARKRSEDPQGFKEKATKRKEKSDNNVDASKRLVNFKRKVRYGPIFICSCCHQKMFENQVEKISDEIRVKIDIVDPGIRTKYIEEEINVDLGGKCDSYLCKSCKWYLVRGQMPKLCTKNGLGIDKIEDDDLKLTELENNLIARNIIFQKIHKLPKSRWSGTHDRLINVPVGPDDVINTVESLPRTPAEAGIIPIVPVNLKRKLEYKTTHLSQLIDTKKIFKYLKYLHDMGHPGYKFYDDYNTYKKRCFSEDLTGSKLVFPEAEAEIVELDVYLSELKYADDSKIAAVGKEDQTVENGENSEEDKCEKEEYEYKTKDPIRKFQYDYNKTTCMTNKFPEADSGSALDFAPAEGKIPTSILKDKDWDINSFPNLHPSGKNKMFQDRDKKLTPQQYLGHRLRNKDNRFEQCTPYVFAAAGYVEEKQMERNIGLSYNKGKKTVSNDGSKMYELEDAFSVLDNVKGTPKYWKKAKGEILGKIDNFGPFHWFYTLSCADMRWEENFTSILREKGYKIIWETQKNNDVVVEVEFVKEGEIRKMILNKFLEEECDESLHEFIRTNVFTATRNFIQRVRSFRTEIMMGKNNPMKIKYWSDKMEFQGRGAGHIHGVAWSDLAEISELIKDEKKVGVVLCTDENTSEKEEGAEEVNHLENAYRNLRENNLLSGDEERALIDFVDRSVTCTLNPEMAAKMINVYRNKEDGMKIIEIVKDVQVHHHTKSCKKNGCATTCRFRFPKFPMWETILTKSQVEEDDPEIIKERLERHQIILKKVMDVLEEEEIINEIISEFEKENESIEEYRHNRKTRILKILEFADVEPDEYVEALKESSRRGINIILARDIDELYVNNYVPEYIEAWNGNIDWSPVFDFFAVVTYVTEYFTKDESGTSSFLSEAAKQIKNLPIKDQRRCIKNVFLTHRQMGLSEAFMKIYPDIRLKDSNISSVFVPLGKKEDISRYLMRADPDQDYGCIELFEIADREGLYYEKPNWVDKYLRRDRSEWNELCLPHYVKMFDPIHRKEKEIPEEEENDEIDSDADLEILNEKEISELEKNMIKYGQEVKFHYLITETGEMGKPLPQLMKVESPCPGEPNFLRKRKHPKSLRFYKVKRELNPARFFLHELMMYRHFGPEEYERWQNDENCTEDYEKYKENIKKVKAKVMEWMEDVEEARYFVEEVMKNNVDVEETGENMDPEMHQDDTECEMEGIEEDDKYIHLDPEGLKDRDVPDTRNWYKKLELIDQTELEEKTCKLDKWQRNVIDVALKFVRGLRKYENGVDRLPRAENLVVIGGAGSGKSTVIECLTQWCHRLLEKSGDDPNSPYILKAATTGAASSLIEGSTVHSSLGFDFSSKHTSLSDKTREMRIEQMKNLRILVIDEFSMMKSDILYRIHLRLSELKHNNNYFGGVLVILFGDPAQLKPVRGSYIFAAPNCKDYKLAYGDGTDSLWRSFSVINLEENHRQGKDKSYADMLNRIRVGKHTQEDMEILKSRVRTKGHADTKGALFISAKVIPVAKFNDISLIKTAGKLYVSQATHIQAMAKTYKPKIDKKSGRIGDTQFVDEFKFKIGARVILIFNIDVSDLLCNGALGSVLGVEEGQNGKITAVIVKFDNPVAGKQARERNPGLAKKYPQGTIVKKMEQEYSLARTQGLISSTARLIQFPLVLAWAVTVHKFQGQTVKAPQKVVVDLKSVFEAAQAYVMASRVQELEQLYILEELPKDKIYANQAALAEIERLVQVSKNKNPTKWLNQDQKSTVRISFLNCRSIKNKFHNILSDRSLLLSDVMILTETWLKENDDVSSYTLPGYDQNLNKRGRGKGISTYYKGTDFKFEIDINHDGFSLSKMSGRDLDIIGVYRSQNGSIVNMINEIKKLYNTDKTTVIGGDFNICFIKQPKNSVTTSLADIGFKQIVTEATHIEGGTIDHIYIAQEFCKKIDFELELYPKYYSDHDGLFLTIWKTSEGQ